MIDQARTPHSFEVRILRQDGPGKSSYWERHKVDYEQGMNIILAELDKQIFPDGGHIRRNPSVQLSTLADFCMLKMPTPPQTAPTKPATVLPGLTLGTILVLPSSLPEK